MSPHASDSNAVLQSWTKRALIASELIICSILIAVNVVRQRKRTKKLVLSGKTEPVSLLTWSTVCFMWCIFGMLIFLATSIPTLCEVMSVLIGPGWIYPHIFLSLYQLARLKATFSLDANHHDLTTEELAYPNWIYIALYLYGLQSVIHSFAVPLSRFLSGSLETVERPNDSGCSVETQVSSLTVSIALTSARLFAYLIWDWFIVGMYIYKLHQIRSRFTESRRLHRQIRAVMKRILLLTAITEIVFIVTFSAFGFVAQSWSEAILIPIDILVTFGVLHLMMDRNDNDYLLMLRCLRRCGCLKLCCCCFGDLELEYAQIGGEDEEETQQEEQSEIEVQTMDTDGIHEEKTNRRESSAI
mmetsp:Transcript_66326/g.105523  ORF Transcript_66326/g.105523 Transcript_66326/m.105523 type:complete len:358 (-) Transcript_66326:12-1085(-)|eukprot:CAMPEP_0197057058 /NCGR_PEP_ID=MMETSP1384-20130603/92492_1 /TAXON_ID=29189 /ORGANISM="Ammonia sp." /LENGTH=357 /DNA_ID=CAMNT_0042491301 /DNA_START=34 /DNA_END=1107 /DNA_ORIENTATION=+